MHRLRLLTLACVLAASGGGASRAQDAASPPCVLDKCLSKTQGDAVARNRAPRPGPLAPGAFDFYVLALSWSPSFCLDGGDRKSPRQCAAGANPGFVVHGLWPQNQHGYPTECGGLASPSRMALDGVQGLYPDEGLARHEWRQHGTCTGLSPTDYFATVRRARSGVTIPPDFQAPPAGGTWAPLDVARSFMAANPGLRLNDMAVTCRGRALEEVRLCLAKDLRGFVPCPEVARASCRRPMTVPAGRS